MKAFFGKIRFFLLLFFIGIGSNLFAQMITPTDTLYGNEWIDYQQNYFKIKVGADGIYRINYATLNNAGVFLGATVPNGNQLELYRLGQKVPLYVSSNGVLGASDYIEFYGQKNRGEIDKYIYEEEAFQVNPLYSLFSDTSTYYLTWTTTPNATQFSNTPNNLTNLPPKEMYCWGTEIIEYHDRLILGRYYGRSSDLAAKYDLGEGYAHNSESTNQTITINANDYNNTGIDAELSVRLLAKDGIHHLSIDVNNTNFMVDTFQNWAVKEYKINIPNGNLSVANQVKIEGTASVDDKYRLSNITFTYSRNYNFGNSDYFEFELDGNNQTQYLEIANFNHSGQAPILYDLTTYDRIVTQVVNDTVKVVLPATNVRRQLILVNPNAINNITIVEEFAFTDFSAVSGDYLILSNALLFDDGNGINYVQNYADYRSTPQGGGYNALIVDIEQVYEQFGYGITHHEQAIRNFVHWSIKNWDSKFLFIIGKGRLYPNTRNKSLSAAEFDLVPAFGFPSSDNLFAADNNSHIPKIAVGRIAAFTPDMVRQYLKKVQDLESIHQTAGQTIDEKAWMKNVLHLGGGDENIQAFIKGRLEEMRDTATTGVFGANVFSLYKHSTDVIQSASTDDVINFIDNGVSLITFFGHSAPNTLDFDIGNPNQYQNYGKYPMIYAMGCNTNRLLEARSTLSEDYVFVEDRGAIGFIGSTATTSLSNLNIYGRIFYQQLSNDLYGATIGDIMKATVENYPLAGYWGELVQNNILLHGDPAIRLNPHTAPDFVVNTKETVINPSFVNVQSDSFQLDLAIMNIGKSVEDSITVLIEQEFPNGERAIIKNLLLPSPNYQTIYTVFIPITNKEILGENKLHITIDPENTIQEAPIAAELNNYTTLSFLMVSNNAFPVSPLEFSIVSSPSKAILKASTSNAFSASTPYYLEIDTSGLFDSPMKETKIIQSVGGLIEWSPNMNWLDSTTYYWRISIDSTETRGKGFDWKESSFTFINGSSEGWEQRGIYQKIQTQLNSIFLDSVSLQFIYENEEKELKIQNAAFPTINYSEAALFLDGFKEFVFWPCPNNNQQVMLVGILDQNTLNFKINQYNNNVSPNCWNSDLKWFIFNLYDTNERQKIIDSLQAVNPGDYVALFITQRQGNTLFADQWGADSVTLGTNIFQVLEAEGATKIRDLATNQRPYIFIYKKDDPTWSGSREVHAVANEIITATTNVTGRGNKGTITSLPIGPALSYGSVHWNTINNSPISDTISLDIIGVMQSGKDTLLYQGLQAFDTTLAFIDAAIYPYLKLRYNTNDNIDKTIPQIDYWRVLYDPVPEIALRPQLHTVFHGDTLQQGEILNFEIAAENISESDMDSVLVKYTITDEFNNEIKEYNRLKPLVQGDSLVAAFTFDTKMLKNKNLLAVDINPDNDQLEQFHFNNIGVKEFFVKQDKRNPLLDVTFDGMHIMNGDLVSASPEVVITLNDENQYLALDDTSLFRIFIQDPYGVTKQYYVDGDTLVFYPAEKEDLDNKNEARLVLNPYFLQDGTYRLQVQARDATGNESGKADYLIDFEVIKEAKISYILNYPNPFTTSTQFVFTLTGERVPDDLRIQIMTVSGDLVREITKEELGDLHVGHNRTEFKWNGTDQFGDRLANGVYLYRMIATMDGEKMDIYNNGTLQYFKSEFGKLVILR